MEKNELRRKKIIQNIERERIEFLRNKISLKSKMKLSRLNALNKENFQRNIQHLVQQKETKRDMKLHSKEKDELVLPNVSSHSEISRRELIVTTPQKQIISIDKEEHEELQKEQDVQRAEVEYSNKEENKEEHKEELDNFRDRHEEEPKYSDQEGGDTNLINKNLKTDKEYINIDDSEGNEISEESDIVIGQDEKEQRNNSSKQNKSHFHPHESIVTFIEANRDLNSKEEDRYEKQIDVSSDRSKHSNEHKSLEPNDNHSNINESIEFVENDEKEKSSEHQKFQEYIEKRNDVHYKEENSRAYQNQNSNSFLSQFENQERNERIGKSSNKYKGKRSYSGSHDHHSYKPNYRERSYGYGEIHREDSPCFRESSFAQSHKYDDNHDMHNDSSMFIHKDIDFNEPSVEKQLTPMKEFPFEFRDKSFDSKICDYNVNNPTPQNDEIGENIIFEDPMEIPMEEVNYHQSENISEYNEKVIEVKEQKCNIKFCETLVNLFKKIVYEKVLKGAEIYNQEYITSLNIESNCFKQNVLSYEAKLILPKHKIEAKIAKLFLESFNTLCIDVTKLSICCKSSTEQKQYNCLYSDNKAAINSFIGDFKCSDYFPTLDQIDLIILFHQINQFNSTICENSISKYILCARRPMLEKQYFIKWISDVYGVNLRHLIISSISQPSNLDSNQDILQIRLAALLCLFYNIKPSEISEIQLYSIVYIKPNYCLRSSCGNYLLVLPQVYSNLLNKLVLDTETCEMKSCCISVNYDSIRTYCYHNKNRPFMKLSEKVCQTQVERNNSTKKYKFGEIYNDPISYVREFEADHFLQMEEFAAYLAVQTGTNIPRRLLDSEIKLLENTESEEIFLKISNFENEHEIIKTRSLDRYLQLYSVSHDLERQVVPSISCQCSHSYEIKIFEKSAQIDKNPEMESKIKEIKSLGFI